MKVCLKSFFVLFISLSSVFAAKSQTVQVNMDGTLTVIQTDGASATPIHVNPDGTHSLIINNGATAIQLTPSPNRVVAENNPTTFESKTDSTRTTPRKKTPTKAVSDSTEKTNSKVINHQTMIMK